MPSFFNEMKKSFKDVPIAGDQISTAEFLEAAESLIKLFDLLGSSAFSVVQKDMTGNVAKIRSKFLTNPAGLSTLQAIVLDEAGSKKKDATQGLLWLTRGLEFTAASMRRSVDNPTEELSNSFTTAYSKTLSKHHNMLIKPVFKLAMKACPYRADFYKKLADTSGSDPSPEDEAQTLSDLEAWLQALEHIVKIIMDFFASGNYGKGL